MDAGFAEMRTARIVEEVGDAGQRLVGFGVKDVEDCADQQRMAGLFPMVPLVETAFGIDQDVGGAPLIATRPSRSLASWKMQKSRAPGIRTSNRVKRPNPILM